MFLVLGAQKCATSWLYLCLRDHPELHLPVRKLEVEYLGGPLHRERGDDWYLRLVSRGDGGSEPPPGDPRRLQGCGDVSVEYLWDPASPGEVARLFPGARLIVSLRHPVDRAVSAWYWYQRKGLLPAGTSLAEALDAGVRWLESTDAGAAAEERPRAGSPEELVARGCYDAQLARWLERFPPRDLLVLDYAEVAGRPREVLARVWDFLGVSPHEPAPVEDRPKRNTYTPALVRLERLAPRNRVWASLLDRIQRLWPGAPPSPLDELPSHLRAALDEAYAPSMRRLAHLLDRLPAERRPSDPSFLAHGVGGR